LLLQKYKCYNITLVNHYIKESLANVFRSSYYKTYRNNFVQLAIAVALVCALFASFVSHGSHNDLIDDVSEQHCHLCQFSIDHADNDLTLYLSPSSIFVNYSPEKSSYIGTITPYVLPPLRAPPIH